MHCNTAVLHGTHIVAGCRLMGVFGIIKTAAGSTKPKKQ